MRDNTSTTAMPLQLFCCSNCPIERKANIPPSHPLHQLLDYLAAQLYGKNVTLSSEGTIDTSSESSTESAGSPQSIPGPNECAIIVFSDPNIISEASKLPTFDPSRVVSRMYWGKQSPPSPHADNTALSSPPTRPQAANPASSWTWREKVDARNNVGGILNEVEGNMEGKLNKQMTGYECREHGWKYTFVILIGVTPKSAQEIAHERLLEMAAQAGERDGAAEDAPRCNPQ